MEASQIGNVILSDEFGGIGGGNTSALYQGRINGISNWGLKDVEKTLLIVDWQADKQTSDAQFGSDEFSTGCVAFELDDDEYIHGFTIYYDLLRVYGVIFYTNFNQYGCYHADTISQNKSTTSYFIAADDFYYLTGFYEGLGLGLIHYNFNLQNFNHRVLINIAQIGY